MLTFIDKNEVYSERKFDEVSKKQKHYVSLVFRRVLRQLMCLKDWWQDATQRRLLSVCSQLKESLLFFQCWSEFNQMYTQWSINGSSLKSWLKSRLRCHFMGSNSWSSLASVLCPSVWSFGRFIFWGIVCEICLSVTCLPQVIKEPTEPTEPTSTELSYINSFGSTHSDLSDGVPLWRYQNRLHPLWPSGWTLLHRVTDSGSSVTDTVLSSVGGKFEEKQQIPVGIFL